MVHGPHLGVGPTSLITKQTSKNSFFFLKTPSLVLTYTVNTPLTFFFDQKNQKYFKLLEFSYFYNFFYALWIRLGFVHGYATAYKQNLCCNGSGSIRAWAEPLGGLPDAWPPLISQVKH